MTGASHFNEVFLDQVRVPDANRLGPEGQGWGVAMTTLMNERMAMGSFEGLFSFDDLIEHALANRERLDARMRDKLAKLYTWMRTLELHNARVVTKLGKGEIRTLHDVQCIAHHHGIERGVRETQLVSALY